MNYSDVFPPLNRSIPINNNINQYFVLPFGIDLNIEISYLDLCAKYLSKVGIIVFGCRQIAFQIFQNVQSGHQDCDPDAWYERIQYLNNFETSLSLSLSSFLSVVVVFAFFFCWTPFHSQRLMFVMVSIVLNINNKLQWKLVYKIYLKTQSC